MFTRNHSILSLFFFLNAASFLTCSWAVWAGAVDRPPPAVRAASWNPVFKAAVTNSCQ